MADKMANNMLKLIMLVHGLWGYWFAGMFMQCAYFGPVISEQLV